MPASPWQHPSVTTSDSRSRCNTVAGKLNSALKVSYCTTESGYCTSDSGCRCQNSGHTKKTHTQSNGAKCYSCGKIVDGDTCSTAASCPSGVCRGGRCCGTKGKSPGCTKCDADGDCAACSSGYSLTNSWVCEVSYCTTESGKCTGESGCKCLNTAHTRFSHNNGDCFSCGMNYCTAESGKCTSDATFDCSPDTTIWGTADVKLSNGKTDDTGFSSSECEYECSSKSGCKSYVFKSSNGYCELWSKTSPTSTWSGANHCVVRQACSCQDSGHIKRTHTTLSGTECYSCGKILDGDACSSAGSCSSGVCRGGRCCGAKGGGSRLHGVRRRWRLH